MKILITGGTGFVGRHLVEHLRDRGHEVTVLARKIDAALFDQHTGCLEADITVKEDIQAAIIFLQPEVVIHSAAMSKPNDCEADKPGCYLTNVTATVNILEACKVVNAKLIFLSTDFVFGHHGPYSEDDPYDPVNYYGETKMLAEEAVKASGLAYAIARTVLVVGKKLAGQSNTFLHWVKESLAAGKTIRVYTDQQRSATDVNDLCSGIQSIIATRFEGTVHLCGATIFTPYTLAQLVAQYFDYSADLIQPVTRQQQPELAVRPENAVLKTDKAKLELHYQPTIMTDTLKMIFDL